MLWQADGVRTVVVNEPGPPSVLQLGDLPQPEPAASEVLIKVTAAGVNRADLMQRQGYYPPPPGASETIGLEVSGTVAGLGSEVEGWAVGDQCVALLAGGGYAEYAAVPAGQVLPPPPGVDLVTAAGVIEVAATVVSNLDQARLGPGDAFLVHGGSGGIGAFAIQYAKTVGATVIATAGSAEKLEQCRRLGADHAISYRDDWPQLVLDATDGRGVDVILDNMGAKYLANHLAVMALGARLMIIGMQGGREGTLDIGALMAKRGSVTALSLRARPVAEKAAICRRVLEAVWPLIGERVIVVAEPTAYPLAEVVEAHTRLESGDSMGKIVLTVA